MPTKTRNYKKLYALMNEHEINKGDMLLIYGNRATRFRDMSNADFDEMMQQIETVYNSGIKRMQNKVVHYLCLMGYTKNGKPDNQRIQTFIKNIGSRNPERKTLFELNKSGLRGVLTQVQAMYKNELKRSNG